MFTNRLFDGLKSTLGPGRGRAPRRTPRNALAARRLRHEPLEDRRLLSVDPGWAFGLGGAGFEGAVVAVDPGGDVYITGYFEGTVDFDPAGSEPGSPNILSSGASDDAFVAAYSSAGELKWAKQFDCGGDDQGHAIATDGANVYVTGEMTAAPTTAGVFLARLNADTGAEIPMNWNPQYTARPDGFTGGAFAYGIAVDQAGAVYISGNLQSDTDFDGDGNIDAWLDEGLGFVLKLDPEDGVQWVQRSTNQPYVAVDTAGNAYMGGACSAGAQFGDDIITDNSAYVAQLDADTGQFTWATGFEGNFVRAMATDAAGVYVTGSQVGIVKLNAGDGEVLLTTDVIADFDDGRGITVDADGYVHATGNFRGSLAAGDFRLNSAGGSDAYVVKLDPIDGTFLSADRAGGIGGDLGTGIAVDLQGNIYTTGVFRETADFPTGDVLTSAGDGDIFLMKLGQSPITVNRTSPMVTTEDGGSATFEVVLTQQPEYDVTIGISSSDTGEGTVSTPSLTFTPDNWDVPQPVTVTGVDDAEFDGDVAYTVDFDPAQSADPDFDGLDAGKLGLVNQDNDTVTATYANSTPVTLNDLKGKTPGVTTSTISVADSGSVVDLNVQLDISHTADEDLDVTLIAPDGTRVTLFEDVGGTLNDFSGTVLDDEAARPIASGTAPFSFSYQPQQPLSGFDTHELSGTWTLEVVDDTKFQTGTLNSWSITALYAPEGGGNSPPLAADDTGYLVNEDGSLSVAGPGVLANDSDPDGGPGALTAALVAAPSSGSVTLNPDGSFDYTPDPNFNGTDSFTYVANDGQDASNEATVTITVDQVQDGSPAADAGGPYTVAEGGTVVLDASGTTDPDLPYETLTYAWDFDNNGVYDDATGPSPTFDAAALTAGQSVTVGLQVTDSAANTSTDTATITVEEASTEQIYTSTDGPLLIGDLKTVTSTVLATNSDPIVALNVRINLTHDDAANLQVRLLDPSGQALSLASSLDSGDLCYGVVIPGGTVLQHSGVWTLEITDSVKDKLRGTLDGWSLIVNPADPLPLGMESSATANDLALLALVDPDSTDDETDPLTESLVDDLALMLFE